MKRFALTIFTAFSLLVAPLALQGSAAAIDVFQPCSGAAADSSVCTDAKSQSGSSANPIIKVIKIIIHLLALVGGIASIIIIVVSGIRLVTSGGNAQVVANARGGVIYALAGLVIIALAEALVAFVLNKL